MKREEEFFPKGAGWYCDQCKSIGNVDILVWVDPSEMEISHLSEALGGGCDGWCHNCNEEVAVRWDVPLGKANAT